MYSRYKDAEPADTVARIRAIFDRAGIRVDCRTEKHVDGVYTSYLTDNVCRWRTEGKGSTPAYCEASAYGEAMEHVCTHYAFDLATVSDEAKGYGGFFRYPDEQTHPVEKVPELAPAVAAEMREPFLRLGLAVPEEGQLIALWKRILRSEKTTFVPFYHVNSREVRLLPDAILSKMCGTNGGGSGNTPEEAIGHALDEIVERWCKYEMFSRGLTPPEVPDDYIGGRCPELLELKRRIESQGRLRVHVLDATLGREYPVLCVAVIDTKERRYLTNFGCHPQFEIALERCFTEIFQDRQVVPELLARSDMAVWAGFDEAQVRCQRNWAKLLEDDLGLWPEELFGAAPSWPFRPWPAYENYTNRLGMHSQLDRLLRDGAEVYIRSVGFLGFPVYKVYVQGVSISHINFTEDILQDLAVVENIKPFLRCQLDREQMLAFGGRVFGRESIMGRMFFYRLTNEQFDLLYAALLMQYGLRRQAYARIRLWNGEQAALAARVLELAERMPLEKAVGCAERFASARTERFMACFFAEEPFRAMLDYYGFSAESRRSMSGESIQKDRDAFFMRLKDAMRAHPVDQRAMEAIVT